MTLQAKRKFVIHLVFFAIFVLGVSVSWVVFSAIHGVSTIFALLWFPVCQWLVYELAIFIGWERNPDKR